MKKNQCLIVLALCMGFYTTSFSSQQPTWAESAYNKASGLWQTGSRKLSQAKSYAATFIPQSFKDTVNQWSTQKKITVFSAIVSALALIGYNKDILMQTIQDSYDNAPNLGLSDTATKTYSYLPTQAQGVLQYAGKLASEHPKLTTAAVTGASVAGGIAAKKRYDIAVENNLALRTIKHNFDNETYQKASKIHDANYTNAVKKGYVNLWERVKRSIKNPLEGLDERQPGVKSLLEPTIEDAQNTINSSYNALQKYREKGLVQ